MALVHEFTHYGDSSISAALSKDVTESPLTLKAVTSSLLSNVMFSLRNNAYIMCVFGGGGGVWSISISVTSSAVSTEE